MIKGLWWTLGVDEGLRGGDEWFVLVWMISYEDNDCDGERCQQ